MIRAGLTGKSAKGKYTSEWRIDVLSARWSLVSGGNKISCSEDHDGIQYALNLLPRKKIFKISMIMDGTLKIVFDEGHICLELIESDLEEGINWMISYWDRWLLVEKQGHIFELEALAELD